MAAAFASTWRTRVPLWVAWVATLDTAASPAAMVRARTALRKQATVHTVGCHFPQNANRAGAQPANFAYGQQAGYGGYQQQPYGAQPAGYPAPQAYPAQQGGFAAYVFLVAN